MAYADEKNGEISEILLYAGADGAFTLCNDEGDNYSYENGNFSAIGLTYSDNDKTLIFGKACGKYKYQENYEIKLIDEGLPLKAVIVKYEGEEMVIRLV